MKAAILAVGDELLSGQQLDTNSAWLSEQLLNHGWRVVGVSLLGDDELAIATRLSELCAQAELVLVTGGLGPTLDDVTRQGVALAVGEELHMNEAEVDEIRRLFEAAGRTMAESNRRQGLFPKGATVLPNPVGTAAGFRVQHPGGSWIVSFPGPPRELKSMFAGAVEPWLLSDLPRDVRCRVAQFFLYGIPESDFAIRVGDWMAREAEPRIGVCASGRVLKVRIDGTGPATKDLDQRFEFRVAAFRERFAEAIFSETESSTTRALGAHLLREGISFACAESCTGGEIASRLVEMPGISEVFLEGFVTYSDEAKMARLGVEAELLERHGAVSAEVARAMALGAARATGARLALSTTGIAGPGGGSAEKPVGLVYVGVCLDGEVQAHEFRFIDRGRDLIREWSVTSACELARRALLD